MVLRTAEDFINEETDWQDISRLQEAYPYFSVPFIMEWIKKDEKQRDFKDLSRFKINSVLLSFLEKEYQESSREHTHALPAEDTLTAISSSPDYYTFQGIHISDDLPAREDLTDLISADHHGAEANGEEEGLKEKSLLVQMSFNEWLSLITDKKKKEKEDLKEQEELKNNWKKRRLAEAIEEEVDDIPEEVFKMAVDSIEKEEVVSEPIAEVYVLQGKYEQAINIYKKLILQNPEKKVYFASKIDIIRNNFNL